MSTNKPTDGFKRDAMAQVEDRGYLEREMAEPLEGSAPSRSTTYTRQKQVSHPVKVSTRSIDLAFTHNCL
jgi:transposase